MKSVRNVFLGALGAALLMGALYLLFISPSSSAGIDSSLPDGTINPKAHLQDASVDERTPLPNSPTSNHEDDLSAVLIYGSVKLADSGDIVSGAEVFFSLEENGVAVGITRVKTDVEGRFELKTDKDVFGYIYARKDSLASYSQEVDALPLKISVEDTSVGPIQLELFPAEMLKIQVVSSTHGQLLSGARAQSVHKPFQAFEDENDGILQLPLSRKVWQLRIGAPGYEHKQLNVDLSQGFKGPIVVELSPVGKLIGQVLDSEDKPVAGVDLKIKVSRDFIAEQSDADGRFEFHKLPLFKQLEVSAYKKELGKAFKHFTIDTSGELELKLKLIPSESSKKYEDLEIDGWVVDIHDQPIEDARVYLRNVQDPQGDFEVRTDENGRFKFKLNSIFAYIRKMAVSKPGYATQHPVLKGMIGPKVALKIVLEQEFFIQGNLITKDGDPIQGANVYAVSPKLWAQEFEHMKTDATGFFKFDGLPGKVSLLMSKEGFTSEELKNPEMNSDLQDIVLSRLGQITGKVVYKETGEPVKSYKLFLNGKKPKPTPKVIPGTIAHYPNGLLVRNADGLFHLDQLEANVRYELMVYSEKYALEKPVKVFVPEAGEEAPLVLEIGPNNLTYAGTIVDSEGRPLAGVKASLFGASSGPYGFGGVKSFAENAPVFYRGVQLTDAMGRFHFEHVPATSHVFLEAKKENYSILMTENLSRLDEEEKKEISLILYQKSRIKVVIKKDQFPDFGLIRVSSNKSFGRMKSIYPPQNEVVFEHLYPGSYKITASFSIEGTSARDAFSYERHVDLLEGDFQTITFGEDEDKTLSGIARVADQLAVNQLLILKSTETRVGSNTQFGWQKTVETDHQGRFEFREVAQGKYILGLVPRRSMWARGSGFVRAFKTDNSLPVIMGELDVNQVFTFKRLSEVRGSLIQGQGITIVLLAKQDSSVVYAYHSSLNQNHQFSFQEVEPGTYYLHVLEGNREKTRLIQGNIVVFDHGVPIDLGMIDASPLKHKTNNISANPKASD